MPKHANALLRAAAATCLLLFLVACSSGSQSVQSVSIVTTALPAGTVGASYSATIAAAGGTTPYTFSAPAATLPDGLSLSSAGVITGAPTTAATSSFTVSVADARAQRASQSFSLIILAGAPPPVTLSPLSLPGGTVGVTYSATLTAANGNAPYTFSVSSGATPSGLVLSSAGLLTGMPTRAGSSSFVVKAADAKGLTATASYTVTIAPVALTPVSISTGTLPAGTVGSAYSAQIAAINGTRPYTFSISSGTQPTELTLSSAGLLSGTPSAAGTYNFTVTVLDAGGVTASAPFSVTIAASNVTLTLGPATLPTALAGKSYSVSLSVTGGVSPYTFTLTGGNLPGSFSLSNDGLLTGTAPAAGNYTFTAKAVDSGNPQQTGTGSYTLVVVTASVLVSPDDVITTVPQNFFGLHTSVYDTNLNDVSRLPALLQTTGITTLRYPGGNYADRYHWAQFGVTPPHASTTPVCSLNPQDVFLGAGADFGNFLRTVIATNTQPIITVNYGSSVSNSAGSLSPGSNNVLNHCSEPNTSGQPQEAAAWVAYSNGLSSSTQVIGVDATGFDWKTVGFWAGIRAANPLAADDGYNFLRIGHTAPIGIKYWEIGNEVYYNGWSNNLNPESDLHAPYVYSGQYDGASFSSREALQALSPTAYGNNAGPFIQAMKAVDPAILIGVAFSSPGATDPIPLNWDPDLANAVCGSSQIDLAIIHYYPGTYNAVQPGELLSLPQSDLPAQVKFIQSNLTQYCPANASRIKFWLTETSPNGNLAPNFPNPVIGLFTLNEFLTALQVGVLNIDWLELHNGTYLDESENPGPSYFGIQLAHLLAGVGDGVVRTSSTSSSVVSYATAKTDGRKGVLLINADPATPAVVQVTFGGASLGSTATQYSYGIASTQSGTALTGTPFAIPGNTFSVTVPAYTALELLIQ